MTEEQKLRRHFMTEPGKKGNGSGPLREKLRALEMAVENMQLGVTITDTEGKILYTNSAEARMHGYSVEELVGRDVRILAPRELGRPMSREEMGKVRSWTREGVNLRKDGSVFVVQLMSDVVTDEEGTPLGIVTTSEDITNRKRDEEELRKYREDLKALVEERTRELSETAERLLQEAAERRRTEQRFSESHERLLAVMDSLAAGVYVTDMKTHEILFANRQIQDAFGDVIGKTCWQTFHKGLSGPCDFCTNGKLLTDDGRPAGVYTWEFRNAVTGKWVELRDRAIRWIDGRYVRLEIATDITERKKLAEEREDTIAELQKALSNIRTLSGLLPICASCKKIRDDKGYWNRIEAYIRDHTGADFSHSICPECKERLYPGF